MKNRLGNTKLGWIFKLMAQYCRGYHYCIASFSKAWKPELSFCAGSNPSHGVLKVNDDESDWQSSLLGIRLMPIVGQPFCKNNLTTSAIHISFNSIIVVLHMFPWSNYFSCFYHSCLMFTYKLSLQITNFLWSGAQISIQNFKILSFYLLSQSLTYHFVNVTKSNFPITAHREF